MKKGRYLLAVAFSALFAQQTCGQQRVIADTPQAFTHADTLRGMLTPERSCYDVRFYHLDVRIDPIAQFISGSNTIVFVADSEFRRMQVDLFSNLRVEGVTLDGTVAVPYERDSNALFLDLPRILAKGSTHSVTIAYSGNAIVAKNPPWQGGFTWRQDSSGSPWVAVTCEGIGASCWWPNKDHQSDEPDSMLISVTVPPGLEDVSNGRLRGTQQLKDGWTRYDWFVSYPINNYNVTVNIGRFAHFNDVYLSGKDTLTLDYYVLPDHVEKARRQFTQVRSMLKAFEKYFGAYPFVRDGYKLVEAPHNGMEHQSAIAYGNRFLDGYVGRSSSDVGLKFDFIIVHESAHEWWGNSVTARDVADMWIHESFAAYAEALFVEHMFGREASLEYINAKKQNVRNAEPIIGVYDVQHEGSGDMYDKGQLVLNTLRSVIDNDPLWFAILRGLTETYKYKVINADTVIAFVNRMAGKDYSYFFDQYLKKPGIPQFEVFVIQKRDSVTARYRWSTDVRGFRMPIKVTTSENGYEFIEPTTTWKSLLLHSIEPEDFKVAENLFYVNVKLRYGYVDSKLGN